VKTSHSSGRDSPVARFFSATKCGGWTLTCQRPRDSVASTNDCAAFAVSNATRRGVISAEGSTFSVTCVMMPVIPLHSVHELKVVT